jgi:proline iminopeptidase
MNDKLKICLILFMAVTYSEVLLCQPLYIGDNPKIACWQTGSEGNIIIVIHGGPGVDHSYLRPEFDRLADVATIVYYDQRGSGKSESACSYTWQDHVLDLQRIINYFSPGNQVTLAGSSWGAILALLYTIYYQDDVNSLILSGVPNWRGNNSSKIELSNCSEPVYLFNSIVDSLFVRWNIDSLIMDDHSVREMFPSATPDYKELLAERCDSIFSQRFKSRNDTVTNCTFRSLKNAPCFDFIQEIKVPALLFRGDIDCGIPDWSDRIHQRLSNSRLITIPNSCHDPWYIDPDKFFELCYQFLKDI